MSTDEQYLALLDGMPSWDEHLRVVSPKVWQRLVLMRDGCFLHGKQSARNAELHAFGDPLAGPTECELPLQGAHLISQQALRKNALSEFAWDVRVGVGACYRAHRRHDNWVERWPYELLPARLHELAEEIGMTWWVEKHYRKAAA